MNPLQAAAKPGKEVPCLTCRHIFPQDPPFEVECPMCLAPAGQYCKRPSGHQGPFNAFHAERDLEALRAGFYDHNGNENCGPNSNTERTSRILRMKNYKGKIRRLTPC
jgi:hypothetical protein